jgi:DNA-binding response OmpR family regulator
MTETGAAGRQGAPEKMMIFSRRRFVHLAGWGTVLAVLPATAKISSGQPFSRIGDLTINPDTRAITINERVHLTGKEYKLLKFLWLDKGQTLSSTVSNTRRSR